MRYTPFAGLTQLDQNDPITIDGSSFLIKNPKITDQLLRVGAIAHRHDQHPALVNPHVAPTARTVASGGTLQASANYAFTYTVIDKVGGETTPAPAVLVTTGNQIGPPTVAPVLTLVTSAGILPAGNYYYAMTYTDGEGGETTIGPQALLTIPPGYASASIVVSNLATQLGQPNGPVQWRLWRSYEGEDWHLVTQGSQASFDDAGFDPPDNPARPPDANNTASTYSVLLTLPTVAQEPALGSGTAINLYLAPDTNFNDPCFYAQVPLASAGQTIHITQAIVSPGSPPHVATSLPGAGMIYPDTDLVFGVKSPVPRMSLLPSGVAGDVRIAEDSQHIFAVLIPKAAGPKDWVDLSAIAAQAGITIMGSGVGDAVWQVVNHEVFQGGASGTIADFANTASGAVLQVASGLLTTTDPTQTDAVLGALTGVGSQILERQTWATSLPPRGVAVVPQVTGYAGWQGSPVPSTPLQRPPANAQLNSWTAAGWPQGDSQNPPAAAPAPTYVDPSGANQLGDTLSVTVATLVYCTFFWWNGSAWAPLAVDATSGTGYSPNNNFVPVSMRRGAALHETLYGWTWTKPGPLPDGYKLRARIHGIGHSVLGYEDGYEHPAFGVVFNMASDTQGLACFLGRNPNPETNPQRAGTGEYQVGYGLNWSTRPRDIIYDANNWPPVQPEGPGGQYLNAYDAQYIEDVWIEAWRIGNKAYAAFYVADPATGALPVETTVYDTTGTPYGAGNAGYFGLIFNHIADEQVGVEELTMMQATVLPTLTLYNEHEIIFSGSGGVNVAVERAGSGLAQVMVSGGGIELAGSGGVGLTPYETYIEFTGSGGTGVAIQALGGGSARVLISAQGGGGGGGGGVLELAGSAGANPAPFGSETYIEFAGSGGTGVSVQNLGGGSARVLISGGGAGGGSGTVSVYENDRQESISMTNTTGWSAMPTPDRVTVMTASASDEIMVHYDALWTCDQGNNAQAAIFVDGVQVAIVTPNNATPQGQQATFAGGVGYWVPLYTLPPTLGASNDNIGLRSETAVANPSANTDDPFPGSTLMPGGPLVIRGLAAGSHTIDIRFNSTYSGTQNVYAKRRHLRAWVPGAVGAGGGGGGGGSTPLSFLATQQATGLSAAGTGGTKITYNVADHDDTGGYSTTNSRFTAPAAGVYSFEAGVGMQTDGSTHLGDNMRLCIYKNGSLYQILGHETYYSNGFDYYVSGSITMKLAANDYVEMFMVPTRSTNFSTNYLGFFSGRQN